MHPDFLCKTEQKTRKLERSNIRYVGLVSASVGFLLLFITFLTNGKLPKDYGILVLVAPVLAGFGVGFGVGMINFVVYATKAFISVVVEFYTGYDINDIARMLK